MSAAHGALDALKPRSRSFAKAFHFLRLAASAAKRPRRRKLHLQYQTATASCMHFAGRSDASVAESGSILYIQLTRVNAQRCGYGRWRGRSLFTCTGNLVAVKALASSRAGSCRPRAVAKQERARVRGSSEGTVNTRICAALAASAIEFKGGETEQTSGYVGLCAQLVRKLRRKKGRRSAIGFCYVLQSVVAR
jgi:hypothetical protein